MPDTGAISAGSRFGSLRHRDNNLVSYSGLTIRRGTDLGPVASAVHGRAVVRRRASRPAEVGQPLLRTRLRRGTATTAMGVRETTMRDSRSARTEHHVPTLRKALLCNRWRWPKRYKIRRTGNSGLVCLLLRAARHYGGSGVSQAAPWILTRFTPASHSLPTTAPVGR